MTTHPNNPTPIPFPLFSTSSLSHPTLHGCRVVCCVVEKNSLSTRFATRRHAVFEVKHPVHPVNCRKKKQFFFFDHDSVSSLVGRVDIEPGNHQSQRMGGQDAQASESVSALKIGYFKYIINHPIQLIRADGKKKKKTRKIQGEWKTLCPSISLAFRFLSPFWQSICQMQVEF